MSTWSYMAAMTMVLKGSDVGSILSAIITSPSFVSRNAGFPMDERKEMI
jgi:hypothetical protein